MLLLCLVSVLLEFQMQYFPLICQTFAVLMLGFNLFFQNLKLPLLLSLLFLLIKYMHQLALLSLLTQQIEKVFVATFSTSSHKTSDRATPVSRPILSSSTMDRYVNYLNSSDKGKTKPLSFQTTKSLFPKSLVPFKTSVCIKPSASGTISNGAVSDSINTSQLFCTCAVFYF